MDKIEELLRVIFTDHVFSDSSVYDCFGRSWPCLKEESIVSRSLLNDTGSFIQNILEYGPFSAFTYMLNTPMCMYMCVCT